MIEVSDILDINTSKSGSSGEHLRRNSVGRKKGTKKPEQIPFKRPVGMHRELYSLLCADGGLNMDMVPLLPTDAPGGYKQKAKLGAKKVREWKWTPFTNSARKDGAVFHHWRRTTDEVKEYPFAKFNKEIAIPQYSDSEYASHLDITEGWTKSETDHLFDLCRRFDLRFPIIHDRWDLTTYGPKSMEDLKDRYYNINNAMSKLRLEPGASEPKPFVFDAEHERRRKEQLKRLWSKTPEQVEEEEFLRAEQKKIEARKKEREKKTQDLQKLITAADAGGGNTSMGGEPGTPGSIGGVAGNAPLGNKKLSADLKKSAALAAKKKSGKTIATTRKDQLGAGASSEVLLGIKWPDFKTAGVFVRSQKMKLPGSVGQKKIKVIEQILLQVGVDATPTPTEEITAQFNELRSDIVLLYELKSALATCEMEIQSIAHQYEALTNDKLDIPPGLLTENSTSLILNTHHEVTKSISGMLTPTTAQTPNSSTPNSAGAVDLELAVPHRKRKAALEQSNVLRKLKAKML